MVKITQLLSCEQQLCLDHAINTAGINLLTKKQVINQSKMLMTMITMI
jgi:hypothetical protein